MSKHKTRQIARITQATMHLIAKGGLSRISIASIAQEAGITRQTIYNYFDDVEGIIANALSQHSQAFSRLLIEAMDAADDPLQKINALAEVQISMASGEHENIDLDAALSAEQRAVIATHMLPVKSALQTAIVAGLRGGIIAPTVKPDVTATLIWEMTEGAMRAASAHPAEKQTILAAFNKAIGAMLLA